jgi:hypothetical protein
MQRLSRNISRQAAEAAMYNFVLRVLNIFFHLVHLALITFFLFGWLVPALRPAHFILALAILFSWCGLGICYGFGYCLVTDLQWKIKKRLHQEPGTEFYMKYLIDRLTGWDTNPTTVDNITTWVFFVILAISSIILARTYL